MKKKLDYRAKLTIHDADKLTPLEMALLGRWLRGLGADLSNYADYPEEANFAKRFTARYMR